MKYDEKNGAIDKFRKKEKITCKSDLEIEKWLSDKILEISIKETRIDLHDFK